MRLDYIPDIESVARVNDAAVEGVNERFNADLQKQTDRTHPAGLMARARRQNDKK